MRYVLVGNPDSKRVQLYLRELAGVYAGRAYEVAVLPWAEVVPRLGDLSAFPACDSPAIVRIESPGRDSHVARLLLAAGADAADPPIDWINRLMPTGELVRPGQMHRGFVRVLRGLRQSFDARPHLRPTSCPLSIIAMFDKAGTTKTLAAAGVPVPETLDTFPTTPDEFADAVRGTAWPRAYVKLNTGSSGTGIVVADYARGESGITTIADRPGGFFNTRKLHRIHREGMLCRFAFLLREGVCVQRGIPLPQLDGDNFDLRVLCVYGSPVGVVVRLSRGPITNLHLGGRRGAEAAVRAIVPKRVWLDALDHCEEAAGCFTSAVCGVDLAFARGCREYAVLEVNAFGDFFPGWTDAAGVSGHAREIAATMTG